MTHDWQARQSDVAASKRRNATADNGTRDTGQFRQALPQKLGQGQKPDKHDHQRRGTKGITDQRRRRSFEHQSDTLGHRILQSGFVFLLCSHIFGRK